MTVSGRFTDELTRVLLDITELVGPQAPRQYRRNLVWERLSSTQWHGSWEDQPTLPNCVRELDWRAYAGQLEESFRASYSELPEIVGTPLTGWFRFGADSLLQSAVHELWHRHPDWEIREDHLREFAEEVAECLEAKELNFAFLAPLVNLDMEEGLDRVDLTDNTALIRMTSEQISKIYGGPDFLIGTRCRTSPVPCALIGSFKEPVCGCDASVSSRFHNDLSHKLDLIVLGLQTFKPAAVALDGVHMACTGYSPFVNAETSILGADAYVPADGYCLRADECESLKGHLAMFAQKPHPVLEIACTRYGSAVARRTPADRILDAVVGLEAILLHEAGDPKDRGELSFRLALRYAVLPQQASDRKRAFRTMKNLYSARSKIVHGGGVGKLFDIGGRKLPPNEVANMARDILREVILVY